MRWSSQLARPIHQLRLRLGIGTKGKKSQSPVPQHSPLAPSITIVPPSVLSAIDEEEDTADDNQEPWAFIASPPTTTNTNTSSRSPSIHCPAEVHPNPHRTATFPQYLAADPTLPTAQSPRHTSTTGGDGGVPQTLYDADQSHLEPDQFYPLSTSKCFIIPWGRDDYLIRLLRRVHLGDVAYARPGDIRVVAPSRYFSPERGHCIIVQFGIEQWIGRVLLKIGAGDEPDEGVFVASDPHRNMSADPPTPTLHAHPTHTLHPYPSQDMGESRTSSALNTPLNFMLMATPEGSSYRRVAMDPMVEIHTLNDILSNNAPSGSGTAVYTPVQPTTHLVSAARDVMQGVQNLNTGSTSATRDVPRTPSPPTHMISSVELAAGVSLPSFGFESRDDTDGEPSSLSPPRPLPLQAPRPGEMDTPSEGSTDSEGGRNQSQSQRLRRDPQQQRSVEVHPHPHWSLPLRPGGDPYPVDWGRQMMMTDRYVPRPVVNTGEEELQLPGPPRAPALPLRSLPPTPPSTNSNSNHSWYNHHHRYGPMPSDHVQGVNGGRRLNGSAEGPVVYTPETPSPSPLPQPVPPPMNTPPPPRRGMQQQPQELLQQRTHPQRRTQELDGEWSPV